MVMQMSYSKQLRTLMDGRFFFFHEFLKHPLQIGSIIPSSRFLERHVMEAAGVRSAKTIVELGPGTGGTTRAILRAMARHATLLSIEINPNFHALVSCIEDDRLITHLGNAHELKAIIYMYGLSAPEVIISGIPFSTMSYSSGSQILETISSVLDPGGRFVAYQVSKRVACLCQPFLGPGRVEVQLFNIPPMRVYRWEKNGV
jgi:phosphatidylethanolamine/phosphatidyl-N-methylethanolamine N-methyltransferase